MTQKVVPISVAAKNLGVTTSRIHQLISMHGIRTQKVPTVGKRGRAYVRGVNIEDCRASLRAYNEEITLGTTIKENPSILDMTLRDLLITALRT